MLAFSAAGHGGAVERGKRLDAYSSFDSWSMPTVENFVLGVRKVFWLFMMMACFSGDIVTTCRSGIRSGIVDGVLEYGVR